MGKPEGVFQGSPAPSEVPAAAVTNYEAMGTPPGPASVARPKVKNPVIIYFDSFQSFRSVGIDFSELYHFNRPQMTTAISVWAMHQ